MAQDTKATRVLFRAQRSGEFRDTITAVFPDMVERRRANVGTECTCYAHIGQHSTCSLEWAYAETRPAKPHEYAALKAELEAEPFGYRLEVLSSMRGLYRHA